MCYLIFCKNCRMACFGVRQFCTHKNRNLKILNPSILSKFLSIQRFYASALYVPGSKAHKTFAFLVPDLDFDNHFSDAQKLQKDLTLRGLNIDALELQKKWEFYKYINTNRHALEEKRAEINQQIKKINSKKNPSDEDKQKVESLMHQAKLIKEDWKVVKDGVWDLQETIIPELLKLPNEVDQRTPSENPTLLRSADEKPNVPENKRQNHLDIGKNLNLLDYRNPIQYYLCNKAVSFELGVIALSGRVLKESGAMRVAGPDFCRSLLVEGCGMDHDSLTESFILQNTDEVEENYLINRLHLVGSASLPAVLALFSKTSAPSKFPRKIFCTGRQYTPFPNTPANYGLFSACQASAVHALTFMEDKKSTEYESEFQKLIEATSKIYDEIGCHYQIVVRPAKDLNPSESMRVSFEMWSAHSNQYIEVGHVSSCGDYLSKRLLIAHYTSKTNDFSAIISGTLLSVPRVLGCLIEENPEKFILPEKLTDFAY